jgi:hypothetical protein
MAAVVMRHCLEGTNDCPGCLLFDLLELARLPGSVERRPLRPIEAEVGEPALAGDRLDPSAFLAGWSLGAEVQDDGLGNFWLFSMVRHFVCGTAIH